MQSSPSTIGRFCRKVVNTTLLKWIGAGALALAATTALWPNPRAEAAALRMGPAKSLMGTCVVTITVDGYPGVIIKELLTLHEDGGYSAAFSQLIHPLTYSLGSTITSGAVHGNWRWVRGPDGVIEGLGARYLFEEATKNLYGHETIIWRMDEMRKDGTGVGRWETKTYDLAGNLVMWMTGDSGSQPLTEAALLD